MAAQVQARLEAWGARWRIAFRLMDVLRIWFKQCEGDSERSVLYLPRWQNCWSHKDVGVNTFRLGLASDLGIEENPRELAATRGCWRPARIFFAAGDVIAARVIIHARSRL
jgi:hypothetical protein